MHKRHVLHLEGHQTTRVAKTIDSLCWTGKASYKVGVFSRHGRDLLENVTKRTHIRVALKLPLVPRGNSDLFNTDSGIN